MYLPIAAQFPAGDSERLTALFGAAYKAGLLRSDFYPVLQLTLVLSVFQVYCASRPLYQTLLAGDDMSSPAALARAREYITAFVVAGLTAQRSG